MSVEKCDLLLTGGAVVTVDDHRSVFDPGAVAVVGERIVEVGNASDLAGWQADRRIDTSGMVVIPGFADIHQHLFQYLLRGLGEGLSLWPWLSEFIWPVSEAITPEDALVGAQLGAVAAARSGVTTVLDHHYTPTDIDTTVGVAKEIEKVGLRGAVARGMMGDVTAMARKHGLAGDIFHYSTADEIAITQECIEAHPRGSHVEIWPAPVNVIYVSQDMVRASVELARQSGTGWHTHCSEVETDPIFYLEEYGIRPVDWLYEEGLLNSQATLAHGIFLDDNEVERVGETQTGIAYCPISHQYFALGVMRLRDLRSAGAIIGLGLDGGWGGPGDMFANMRQAILLQRVHTRDAPVSNGEEALELATREGARYMGTEAGYLSEGRLADIAVVRLSGPNHSPVHRVLASLVYSATPADVMYTIVGGRIIVENGQCVSVDENAILEEATVRGKALVQNAGLEGLLEPWRHPS